MFVLASNHFQKCFSVNASVWLRMENNFSGNYFQLTGCFEGFDLEMVWSENFHFKPFPDSHAKREREPSTSTSPTSPITAFDFDFADLWTHRSTNRSRLRLRRSTNPRTDLRPRAFDPEPRTHKPISLSLSVSLIFCVILIDPRAFDLWFFCCCCGGVLVVFLLCDGGFCVGGGGKQHFQNVTKHMKIFSRTIFRMQPNT